MELTGAFEMIVVTFTLFLTALALSTIAWMLEAWRGSPSDPKATDLTSEGLTPSTSISLIIPARHETAVLERTVTRILQSHYEHFDIVLVVGDDDPETSQIAYGLAQRYPEKITVTEDENPKKSKPSALNVGLQHCHGEVVGVFDAEDDVSTELLQHVAACFSNPDLSIVQAGVQLVNVRSKWFSLRNCLEYYLWYRSRLHWHVRKGSFIPLGGNSVFIRRSNLLRAGGWDESCLTEDCDLGLRLGVQGDKVEVLYSTSTSTREETPLSLSSFIKQRTRWGQGFIQVLTKGDWRDLPTANQKALALYTLLTPIIQFFALLSVPTSLLGILGLSIGVNVAMFTFLPLVLVFCTLCFELLALRELSKEFALRIGPLQYLVLIVTTIPFQLVLSIAGARALIRELLGRSNWEKTAHSGAHRTNAIPEGEVNASVGS